MPKQDKLKSEEQTIDHIKFIARALFHDTKPSLLKDNQVKKKFSPQNHFKQGNEIGQRLFKGELKLRQANPKNSFEHSPEREKFTQTDYIDIHKQQKIPYFTSLQQFQQSRQRPRQPKKMRPLSESINKNIYGKFKTENRAAKNITQNYRPSIEQQQEVWQQFLGREQEWSKQKRKRKREAELKNISNHSPEVNRWKRNKTINDETIFNREMTEVQKVLLQLKQQTEQIRLKIMKVATEENHPFKFRKTFDSSK